jgi:hypothetical protein
MSESSVAHTGSESKQPTYQDYSLSEARREVLTHGHTNKSDPALPQRSWNSIPMFVPTDTHGHAILHVKRRQDVLNDWIGLWKEWQVTKAAAVFLVLMSFVLIPRNVYVAGAFALAAGYSYGRYLWQDYFFTKDWKKRMLLEAT